MKVFVTICTCPELLTKVSLQCHSASISEECFYVNATCLEFLRKGFVAIAICLEFKSIA